ncbi:MAG: DNA translocase FtsK [Bacteroidota bacterium]|nr:DNA translocase FtsK [Bacteroidota bacterium]
MAKNTYKTNTVKKTKKVKEPKKFNINFFKDRRFHLAIGIFLVLVSIYLLTAFISYLFTGKADQSVVEAIQATGVRESGMETENWLGLMGAFTSHYFIFRWFGIAAFFIPPLLFMLGFKIIFRKDLLPSFPSYIFAIFWTFWLSLFFGYIILHLDEASELGFLSGGIGYELAILFNSIAGWGTLLFLIFSLAVFVIYYFNITSVGLWNGLNKETQSRMSGIGDEGTDRDKWESTDEEEEWKEELLDPVSDEDELSTWNVAGSSAKSLIAEKERQPSLELDFDQILKEHEDVGVEEEEEDLELLIHEEEIEDGMATKVENYDPTLDLGSYRYPTIDLLNEYASTKVQVTKDELEQNKDKIVETLINFKIGISSIKATIGPTVTLYEIVPEAGVKISKIKNLEDDIALSLAALGIRIIAPIPGKGTIGIEVPNKNREMVAMRSVLTTEKFMKSDKELPIVLGKTISNEVYVTDLAKMPHLLMAGATGQGKSVGLNVLLASLIYKKHPSQLKFVLVDPKKVELTLFNKIERHFLAKLPDTEEAIITDTKKVINTLNSLCIEMDFRYDLLKEAGCRNLKEYNAKFVERRLSPLKGHRFLPYIVLVIDELADLMMTAGKEVETPIARLAQLARAIGIHLVVATQRPSVNVITGIIKANFPARLSFRVTSKIDSRTILDTGGAEQLVGQGDMLLSIGSEIIRLQCPFLDTPEVENICEFIGSQRGYETAYMLPEFVGDESGDTLSSIDLSDRDDLFDDAARLIVAHQQGSTSLIQRKLKLGYNRAGRLIDQLEAAGIVGPFEGSKAREVLIRDEHSLEQLLNGIDKK